MKQRLNQTGKWGVFILLLLAIFQTNCTTTPSATPTPEILEDCAWHGLAIAWIDQNEDGIQDEGEPPLTNIPIYVDDIVIGAGELSYFNPVGSGTTDWTGEASLYVWLPGCPETQFSIYVPEVPRGYYLTTEPEIIADADSRDTVAMFGFGYLPNTPTVTPRPADPICTSYRLIEQGSNHITDMASTNDGIIWVATYGSGAYQYIPDQDEWVHYTTSDGLRGNNIYSVTPIAGEGIWFALSNGASFFDGLNWTSYTISDGLIAMHVGEIDVDQDDRVWFATTEGVSRLDADRNTWHSYTEADGLPYDYITSVAVAPDNSVWFSTLGHNIFRFLPSDDANEDGEWVTYQGGDGYYDDNDEWIYEAPREFESIAFSEDGSIWFVDYDGLRSGNLSGETWYHYYTPCWLNDLALAADGSIWGAAGYEDVEICRFIPSRVPGGGGIWDAGAAEGWEIYTTDYGLTIPEEHLDSDDEAEAITIDSDGAIWIATSHAAIRCVFER